MSVSCIYRAILYKIKLNVFLTKLYADDVTLPHEAQCLTLRLNTIVCAKRLHTDS